MPTSGPYLYDWLSNPLESGISFKVFPLHPSQAQGKVLGYTFTYAPMEKPNNAILVELTGNMTRKNVTLSNLKEGSYSIIIAGFTRKGTGPYRIYNISCKFRTKKTTINVKWTEEIQAS